MKSNLIITATLAGLFAIGCISVNKQIQCTQSPSLQPPLMGWASWNNFHVGISESIIKDQVDAMVKLKLSDHGYTHFNIDDGFFGGRDENGNIIHHPTRFPQGMQHISDYIRNKGFIPGIYSDAGINTCASYYDNDSIGSGMGLFGHEHQDLKMMLKDWNFDFIKVDYCGAKRMGLDEQTTYTRIANIARDIKPNVGFNVCRWEFPGEWVTSIADSWRISRDLRANFNSVLKTIDANADLWKYASYGHYNDMDMLQVGRGMTYNEDKTHFSMWCLMHSPLLLGNDLTKTSDQTMSIITNQELIAINQSKYVYQARRLKKDGDLEVWGRPLISTMSGKVVIALLNRSETAQTISTTIGDIGLNAEKSYTMKDLWTKEQFPASTNSIINREVPPHGIIVLAIDGETIPYNIYQE